MGNKLKVNGTIVFDFFNNIIMLLVMVCTAYPFVHVVMASFSAPEGLARHTDRKIRFRRKRTKWYCNCHCCLADIEVH